METWFPWLLWIGGVIFLAVGPKRRLLGKHVPLQAYPFLAALVFASSRLDGRDQLLLMGLLLWGVVWTEPDDERNKAFSGAEIFRARTTVWLVFFGVPLVLGWLIQRVAAVFTP